MKMDESKEIATDDKPSVRKDDISVKHIEDARRTLAKILNLLEGTVENVKWACDKEGWYDGVVDQMKDASINLGFALATFTRWFDDL